MIRVRFLQTVFVLAMAFVPMIARAAEPIVPLAPAELLKFLPKAPESWRTTQSWAVNEYKSWLMTTAAREFEGPPPAGTPAPPEKPKIRVRIMDTGFAPGQLPQFEQFAPGPIPGGRKFLYKEVPAIETGDERTRRFVACVGGRFMVLVQAAGLDEKEMTRFLESLDLAGLARVPATGESKIPHPAIIVRVDELQPKKNRSYRLYWGKPGQDAASGR